MNKKGQIIMEFLMTYGWAILGAIVVIAVLSIYFKPNTEVIGIENLSCVDIAKSFCLNNSMEYYSLQNSFSKGIYFECINLTSREVHDYRFLQSELNRC